MSEDKNKQLVHLLGSISGEAAQLVEKLTGKMHKVIVIALDGENVHYVSNGLPFHHVKAACEVVSQSIEKASVKEPSRLLLPEAVRAAMN
jgi:hypothetical protein